MEKPLFVAGATGYVGGRLVPLLLSKGYRVRVFSRSLQKVRSRPWGGHENLDVVQGDMHDADSVRRAVRGCGVVYYLVHCMEAGNEDFCDADRRAARNMVLALKGSGAERIIYLSGLLPDDAQLSAHLRSRGEVAETLSLSETPLTTLRAAQLIGAGSASFEMIRWLVDRLPIMITPKWTHVRTQPIAIRDALGYLLGVLQHPETASETYDIGGPDILSYKDLFHMYADAANLRRRMLIPFPWLPLRISAAWISLITPIPGALAKPLIEGMRNEVICSENRIRDIIPMQLTPLRTAIERALGQVRQRDVTSSWFDAGTPVLPEWVQRGDARYAGAAVYNDAYSICLDADAAAIWQHIVRIGGTAGWYSKNALWRLRGLMDKIMGGPGMHRGRRNPTELCVGDGLDFWRVLEIRPEQRLLLFTEMRLPGEGLLDLRLASCSGSGPSSCTSSGPVQAENQSEADQNKCGKISQGTELTLSLYFRPHGLPGLLYWYAVSPFHRFVFMDMLRAIAKRVGKPVLRGPVRTKVPFGD